MRRVCAAGGRSAASRSARRSATATWPASAGGGSSTTSTSCATTCSTRSAALDGVLPGRRHRRALRQAARRALQHGRRRRAPGRGGGRGGHASTTARCRCCACPARCSPSSPPAPDCGRSARASPTGATCPTGALVPRSAPGALVTDPDEVAARAVRMAVERQVVGGRRRGRAACRSTSICLHGDTPGAVALAGRVRAALIDGRGDAGPVRLTLSSQRAGRVRRSEVSVRRPGRAGPAGGGPAPSAVTPHRDAPVLPGQVAGRVLGVGVAGRRLGDDLQHAGRHVAR